MDRTDVIIITLLALLIAMVLTLSALILAFLQKQSTDEGAKKRGKKEQTRRKEARAYLSSDERGRVLRDREHTNFMNYDGDEQKPIDVEAILAERGTRRSIYP